MLKEIESGLSTVSTTTKDVTKVKKNYNTLHIVRAKGCKGKLIANP